MDVTKVDISNKMIGCVRQSHSVYYRMLNNWRKRSSLHKRNMPERTEKERRRLLVFSSRKSKS